MSDIKNQEIISNNDLSQINGGTDSNTKYPIDTNNPICPNCKAPLRKHDHDGQTRTDRFVCIGCHKTYFRHWDGDFWTD